MVGRGQYIAERLLSINEKKKWIDPPPTDVRLRAIQDEQIFQTARLVKCVILSLSPNTVAVNDVDKLWTLFERNGVRLFAYFPWTKRRPKLDKERRN